MLCYCLNSKVIQLYTCMYLLHLLFHLMVYHKKLNIVPVLDYGTLGLAGVVYHVIYIGLARKFVQIFYSKPQMTI